MTTTEDIFSVLGVARKEGEDCLTQFKSEEEKRVEDNIALYKLMLEEKSKQRDEAQTRWQAIEVACVKIERLIKLSEEYKNEMSKPFSFEPPSLAKAECILEKINPIGRRQRGSSIADSIIMALAEKPRNAEDIAAATGLTKSQVYSWTYMNKKYVLRQGSRYNIEYQLTEAGKKLSEVIKSIV